MEHETKHINNSTHILPTEARKHTYHLLHKYIYLQKNI